MSDNTFSPLRCRLPRKPSCLIENVLFYRCAKCGNTAHFWQPKQTPEPSCCEEKMERLMPAQASDKFAYDIIGGFNNNAIAARWLGGNPDWICLKSFTGVFFKIVPAGKRPPVYFALADEDAYAYCGREVCQKCLYSCKKGCVLYFYEGQTLYELPLDEKAQYFQV